MNRSGLLLAALLATVSGGCATTYSLSAMPRQEQEVAYHMGVPALRSIKPASVVEVIPRAATFEGRSEVFIVAYNDSGEPHTLGTENISALRDGGAHRIFTFAELQRQAEREAAWQQFAVALSAAAQSISNAQAAYSTSYSNYSGYSTATATSRYGTATATGSTFGASTTTTYNPAITQRLEAENQARTQSQLSQIEGQLGATVRDLQQNILRTTTIQPGMSFGGRVVLDTPQLDENEDEIELTVDFAGDQHVFLFSAAKQ